MKKGGGLFIVIAGTAEHCCMCIPGRAGVERSLTCVRPSSPPPSPHLTSPPSPPLPSPPLTSPSLPEFRSMQHYAVPSASVSPSARLCIALGLGILLGSALSLQSPSASQLRAAVATTATTPQVPITAEGSVSHYASACTGRTPCQPQGAPLVHSAAPLMGSSSRDGSYPTPPISPPKASWLPHSGPLFGWALSAFVVLALCRAVRSLLGPPKGPALLPPMAMAATTSDGGADGLISIRDCGLEKSRFKQIGTLCLCTPCLCTLSADRGPSLPRCCQLVHGPAQHGLKAPSTRPNKGKGIVHATYSQLALLVPRHPTMF